MESRVIKGDCLDVLKTLPDASVDSICTDPPYGLSFMGKKWDYDVPTTEVWQECLRVLKPGGQLLSFFGTRTYHRGVVRVEDAGFEIRDQIGFAYGTGFPKSLNIGCRCSTVQNTHNGTQEVPEHDVRQVRKADLPPSEHDANKQDEDVQPPLPEPAAGKLAPAHAGEHSETCGIDDGREEPSLERGSDLLEEARQLQADKVRPLPVGVPANGAEGRLHHGAPAARGDARGEAAGTDGGGASHQPRPARQPARKPDAVPEQQGAQDLRVVCEGCGKIKGREGFGTALKPAWEPIVVARKPLIGTVAENVLAHGTGAINVDGCRVGSDRTTRNNTAEMGYHGGNLASEYNTGSVQGRWPANLCHDGSEEVVGCFPQTKSGKMMPTHTNANRAVFGQNADGGYETMETYGDSGSAARFFYCAKASKRDRDEGLESFQEKDGAAYSNGNGFSSKEVERGRAPRGTLRSNHHPTVKPTDLMRWLVRLVTPPGGTVLDPFCGSGSTGKAAKLEGFGFIGIEREAEYAKIAEARINAVPDTLL